MTNTRRGFLGIVAAGTIALSSAPSLAATGPSTLVTGDARTEATYGCLVKTLKGDSVASLVFKMADGDQFITVNESTHVAIRLSPAEDKWLRLQVFAVDANGQEGSQLESMLIGDRTVANFPALGISFHIFSAPD